MTTQALAPFVVTASSQVAAALVIRTLPLTLWALGSKRIRFPEKLGALTLYCSLVVLARSVDHQFLSVLGTLALGALYFTSAAALLVALATRGLAMRVPRWCVLAACVCVFLLAPAFAIRGPGQSIVLLAGWELTLSSFSYAVEARAGTKREGMFFLLVNPVLCFPERGAWTSESRTLDVRGMGRIAAGVAFLFGAAGVIQFLPELARAPLPSTPFASYGSFVLRHAAGIVKAYLAHAGVAHVLLGLLSSAGYRAPERYLMPLLATSPADFWRRWNVYVGSWFRRYVFGPLALRLARRTKLGPTWRISVAVLLTFFAAGVAHEAIWFGQGMRHGTALIAFTFQGTMLLVFELATRVGSRLRVQESVSSFVGRVGLWHTLLVMAWLLKPSPG